MATGAEVMQKFMQLLPEVNNLGVQGFAYLLDTASPEELSELNDASDVVLENVARVKALLEAQPQTG